MSKAILTVSTSTATQSVALGTNDGRLICRSQRWRRGEPRGLLRDIEAVLAEAELQWTSLQRLVCDVGPGSFTGLRLGLSTVRALGWGLNLPCTAVGSLEAMAMQALKRDDNATKSAQVVAVLPSRRDHVYARLADDDGVGEREWSIDNLSAHMRQLSLSAVVGPSATLSALKTPPPLQIDVAAPAIEMIHELGVSGPTISAMQLTPRYCALSQPERLAMGTANA